MIRIAYQGIPGSNSEAASAVFANNQGFTESGVTYIPAVHSMGVVELLQKGGKYYELYMTQFAGQET